MEMTLKMAKIKIKPGGSFLVLLELLNFQEYNIMDQ